MPDEYRKSSDGSAPSFRERDSNNFTLVKNQLFLVVAIFSILFSTSITLLQTNQRYRLQELELTSKQSELNQSEPLIRELIDLRRLYFNNSALDNSQRIKILEFLVEVETNDKYREWARDELKRINNNNSSQFN